MTSSGGTGSNGTANGDGDGDDNGDDDEEDDSDCSSGDDDSSSTAPPPPPSTSTAAAAGGGSTGVPPPPPPPPPSTTSAVPAGDTGSPAAGPANSSQSATPTTPPTPTGNSSTTPSGTGAGGCPTDMKGVTFNGGFNPGMFDTIGAASDWITFGLTGASGGSPAASAAYIPMMAFASDVPAAVSLVTGPNPPDWMLTFNEPDYAYGGTSPTMNPTEAAAAIEPLLKAGATKTRFVAPVTADSTSDWLDEFYTACNCKSFFSAYNIHIYTPSADTVQQTLEAFHTKYPDQHLWLTEVAPGMATPACSLGWDTVTTFMQQVYKFAAGSGWVDRVFWNSGNQIGGGDQNVCNSYLLGSSGSPSPLLASYQAINCQ